MIKILISLLLGTVLGMAQSHYTLTLSKDKVYVGEPLTATLTLENNSSEVMTKIRPSPFHPKGYKVVPLSERSDTGSLRRYLLIPHLTGTHTLPSQRIEVAHKDPATYRNIWQTLQSPPVTLTVLPLPRGIDTVGNFTLKSTIDHTQVQANTPLNLTITIEGTGSLETVEPLQLDLKDALVFGSSTPVTSQIIKGAYHSTLTQTFSIVAEKDFTLPPLTWRYLNTETGLTETLATPTYPIQVKAKSQAKQIQTKVILIFFGIVIGSLLTLLILKWRTRRKNPPTDLSKQIRKARSDPALYTLLLPYADNDEIAGILKRLEENIAQKATHSIDRSYIASLLA